MRPNPTKNATAPIEPGVRSLWSMHDCNRHEISAWGNLLSEGRWQMLWVREWGERLGRKGEIVRSRMIAGRLRMEATWWKESEYIPFPQVVATWVSTINHFPNGINCTVPSCLVGLLGCSPKEDLSNFQIYHSPPGWNAFPSGPGFCGTFAPLSTSFPCCHSKLPCKFPHAHLHLSTERQRIIL